jgi:hypothetical protein
MGKAYIHSMLRRPDDLSTLLQMLQAAHMTGKLVCSCCGSGPAVWYANPGGNNRAELAKLHPVHCSSILAPDINTKSSTQVVNWQQREAASAAAHQLIVQAGALHSPHHERLVGPSQELCWAVHIPAGASAV